MTRTLDDFLTTSRSVVEPISSLSAMYFVYGLYTALFISYIRILRCRCKGVGLGEGRPAKTLYLLPTVILFILTTLVVIGRTIYRGIHMYFAFDAAQTKNYRALVLYLQHDPRKTIGLALSVICSTLLNVTADYILIHRCHTIWGSRKRITIPLAVASIGTNVVGIVGTGMFVKGDWNMKLAKNRKLSARGNSLYGDFLVMSVIVNMLITILTAGRIWWMSRQSHGNGRLYRFILRIIIESGLIYPIFTLIHIITLQVVSYRNLEFEFACISYQTAGIAPTLIVVRTQLGKTVKTMHDHVVSEIRLSSRLPPPGCSDNDSRTQAPDDASNIQQPYEGSDNLDWKKITS